MLDKCVGLAALKEVVIVSVTGIFAPNLPEKSLQSMSGLCSPCVADRSAHQHQVHVEDVETNSLEST